MPDPRHPERRIRLTTAGLLAAALVTAVACGPGDVDQYNQPAQITSVGPVAFDGSAVLIDYTLDDAEGDDQAISVGICPEDDDGGVDCPTPVSGAGGDGRTRLPTTPRGTDVLHRLSWNVGCGRVDDDQCLETDPETTYVAYLSIDGNDRTVASPPFSLSGLGADTVPACDTSIRAVPEPCQPDDDG